MATLPCCINSPCFDPSNPIANLSAELPDADVFLGFNSGWGGNTPPIGSSWGTLGCTSFCQSTISQADADTCAANQQIACTTQKGGGGTDNPGWQDPGGNPTPLFSNHSEHCDIICPDGLPFRFTVAAGQYSALSQAQADAIAQSRACTIGQSERLCLNSIPGSACIGLNYGADIYTEGGTLPISFSIVSGSIPTGMSFGAISAYACEIAGIPTTPGNYSFTVRAVDRFGVFMVKSYSITVLGVVGGLPGAQLNKAYSYQIPVTGGTGPFVIGVPSGSLPTGVSVGSSGLISGTPTTQGTYTFQVSILDTATGFTCYQNLSITVTSSCPDWSQVTYAPVLSFGNQTHSFVGGTIALSLVSPGPGFVGGSDSTDDGIGTLLYTGPGCNGKITFTVGAFTAGVFNDSGFKILQDGVPLVEVNTGALPAGPGVYVSTFTVAAGTNSVITIEPLAQIVFPPRAWIYTNGAFPGNLNWTAVIANA